jgi:hypothetical protein
MKKNKLMTLAALMCGGATLFQSCLGGGGFWEGMFGRGWPTNNLWLNIGIDILNEELFG